MKKITNNNKILIAILLIYIAISIIARYTGHTGYYTIGACLLLLIWVVVSILSYKDYDSTSGADVVIFIFSLFSKMLCLTGIIFHIAAYPGESVIRMTAMILILLYIIVCLIRNKPKEALVGLIYREMLIWL